MLVRINIKVLPSSSKDEIAGWLGESLKIRVMAPPEKGKANKSVINLLAKRLGIPVSDIQIESGSSSQRKVVLISGLSANEVEHKLVIRK